MKLDIVDLISIAKTRTAEIMNEEHTITLTFSDILNLRDCVEQTKKVIQDIHAENMDEELEICDRLLRKLDVGDTGEIA